jgi:hypothetical protein
MKGKVIYVQIIIIRCDKIHLSRSYFGRERERVPLPQLRHGDVEAQREADKALALHDDVNAALASDRAK